MSDALDYLVKARPEAMTMYFSFLKDAGSRLDPKTRNLISVITKVDAQTERGLKQYLKRALREGCTGAEIVDALLMAFPTLGLAKIVWATDVILGMKLPEFDLDAPVPPQDADDHRVWHDLIEAGTVGVGETARVECDGRSVFVHRAADGHRVYDSLCPHQQSDIPHLALDGTRLTCPRHKWAFDVTTGACIDKGDAPLTQWASRIENGRVQAFW